MNELNQAAALFAARLLNGVPVGVVIAFATWMLLRLLGGKNSSTRFAVWFSALLAVGILPLLTASWGAPGAVRAAAFTAPTFWGSVLLCIWAAIAGVALFRLGLGVRNLRTLRSQHQSVQPTALPPILQQTLAEFPSSRKVTLAISDELRVPTALGFLRPMIILPAWTLRELSPRDLNAILIHELAHLKRCDDFTNLAQKVLRAIFFFNPALCWIDNRLSLEREIACDDIVLARTANPRAYAECLVSLAEKSFVRRGVALAQAAVSRMRQTSRRITQILDADRPGSTRVRKPALALVTLFSAACVVTLSRAPELIAFQPSPEHYAPMLASNIEKMQPAMLVPASYNTPAVKTNSKPVHSTAAKPTVLAAKLSHRDPMLVHAVFTNSQFSTQTVFVVMQTQNGAGPMWTLCVWRVTFVKSRPLPAGSAIPAKQI